LGLLLNLSGVHEGVNWLDPFASGYPRPVASPILRYFLSRKSFGTGTHSTMSRISVILSALPGLLIFLAPFPVKGQSIPSNYEFLENRQEAGLFAGTTGQGTGQFGYGPKPGPVFGARYGIHLGGPFGLEATFAYSPTTRDVVDPTRDEGNRVAGEADATLLAFDARLRFSLTGDRTWRGLNPFIFMGVGLAWDIAGESEAEVQVLPDDQFEFGTRFMAPFGAGVRWLITDRFLIRTDVSINMFRIQTPNGYLAPERGFTGVGEKEWVSGPNFSIGIGFHF